MLQSILKAVTLVLLFAVLLGAADPLVEEVFSDIVSDDTVTIGLVGTVAADGGGGSGGGTCPDGNPGC